MDAYIEKLLSAVALGEPSTCGALALLPVVADLPPGPRYVTLAEAIAAGSLTVTEVDRGGDVPTLTARNHGDVAVLVLDGEELRGAKQNRVLNTTVLIGPGKEYAMPVSCTERGRWAYDSERFADSGHVAHQRLRHALKQSVAASARATGAHRSDQGRVWSEVDALHERARVDSPTSAMRDAFEQRRNELDRFTDGFRVAEGQNGLVAVHSGTVIGLELVSRPEAYARLHGKLVRSYAMDSMLDGGRAEAQRDARVAREFVVELSDLIASDHDAPAMGRTRHYTSDRVVGSALTYRAAIVHAAFFGAETAEGGLDRMQSARRRAGYRSFGGERIY